MKIEKYLVVRGFYRKHGNMEILHKRGELVNSTHLTDPTHMLYVQPLSSAKWAIKRTPENAEVVNKWANERWAGDSWYNDWNYLHSINGDTFRIVKDGYTEIGFETFKEIVGIKEEKKIEVGSYISDTMSVGYNVAYQVVSVNGDTLEYVKDGKSVFVHKDDVWILPYPPYSQSCLQEEQPTEEWQPKWGDEVEASDDGRDWIVGYVYCCPHPLYKGEHLITRVMPNNTARYKMVRKPLEIHEFTTEQAKQDIAKLHNLNVNQIKIVE